MTQVKQILSCVMFAFVLMSCKKEALKTDPPNEQILQAATNVYEQVSAGQANCSEAIMGKVRLKVALDSTQSSSGAFTLNMNSRTEKLYNSGGYILVYDLARISSIINLEYVKENAACGNLLQRHYCLQCHNQKFQT